MVSMREHLADIGALGSIAVPSGIDALLTGLTIETMKPDGTGTAAPGFAATPLFFDLSLSPPGPTIPFVLHGGDADATFRLWLGLAQTAPAKKLFDIIGALPGFVLKPASVETSADRTTLSAIDGTVTISGATVALLIEGRSPAAAMKLVPTIGQPDGIVELFFARLPPGGGTEVAASPAALGDSGFGIEAPDGIIIDQSATAGLSDPSWQGLAIPRLFFYLPAGVPVFGDSRVEGRLEIATSPATGLAASIVGQVPPRDGWPGFEVRIECIDPTATGLGSFAPTLVEARMELPVDKYSENIGGHGAVEFAAGKPLVACARFVRDPTAADAATVVTVSIEGQGTGGLISVDAEKGTASRLIVAAGAFATAIIADEGPPENADASGIAIHAVLLAALGASAFLKNKGKLVLNGIEIVSEGRGVPLGGKLKFRLDYSVDVVVKPIGIGGLTVEMKDDVPMRVRMREVVLSFDPSKAGLHKFSLDFGHADMEVEDAGGWQVKGPESLFDILGTRSGRGSLWFEVDLAFRLDLGPVKVSGATLRATLVDGTPHISLRGLDASLAIPALLEGYGGFQIRETGFSASLGASLIPLGASGLASLDVEKGNGATMVLVNLDLDLPGPLPLGASGLALYGAGGTFGIFARPKNAPPDADPVAFLLAWKPNLEGFEPSGGSLSIGLRVAVGTAADMGFTFGAVGGVVITVPDFALRGSISARMMSGRPRLVPINDAIELPAGLSITGAFLIDPAREVTFGLLGQFSVSPLFSVSIPVGGHFPVEHPEQWYINIGADGYWSKDRKGGPAKLTILPGTPLSNEVRGYLMVRGDGLVEFPFDPLRPGSGDDYEGFLVAFGFSLEWKVGLKPILWAEVHGGVDVLVAVSPLIAAGRGWIGGSLHAGPISVGVEATLWFMLAPGRSPYAHAQVCGEIDLWLTSIRKCVEFGIGDKPQLELPKPDVHPLDKLEGEEVVGHGAFLVDDAYRVIGSLGISPDVPATAWPDAIVLFQFASSPNADAALATQFEGIVRPDQAAPNGSDRLQYWWRLHELRLYRIHDDGSEEEQPGPLKAAWQRGRFGDTTKAHEAAELALLTRDRQLFTQRLPDGGRSLPSDPIGEQGSVCQADVSAEPGWALGGPARNLSDVWHLPPDVISPDKARSRVEADVGVASFIIQRNDQEFHVTLRPFGWSELPSDIDVVTAGTEQFSSPSSTSPEFRGAFWLDGGRRLPRGSIGSPQTSALVIMNDTIHDGSVWLVTELERDQCHRYLRIDFITKGQIDTVGPKDIVPLTKRRGEKRRAVLFSAKTSFDRLRIHYAMDAHVGILGIGGVTEEARSWCAQRNQERAEEAAALAAAAAAGPQIDPVTAAGMRSILEPGALYRLDIDLRWGARMHQADGSVQTVDDQSEYAPRNGGAPQTLRHYYFRTFPLPQPSPPVPLAAVFDGRWRFSPPKDLFGPELLERHLIGYTPAQAEINWLRNDPLESHFGVDHVAALAHAYKYKLGVGLQRVDTPGDEGKPGIIASILFPLTRPGLLRTEAAVRLYETALTSPCAQPKPGATLAANVELAPRAWYEVNVALESERSGIPDTKLPGVTFRTSRYRDVAELAAATGFSFGDPGTYTGDIALAVSPSTLSPSDNRGDDFAFEDTLGVLGLEGWPVADEARTSLLWHEANDGWKLGGVLIEAPEPLHRAGRCEVGALSLVMGSGNSVVFDVVRHDRSTARLLFLTRTPFRPVRWFVGTPPHTPWKNLKQSTGKISAVSDERDIDVAVKAVGATAIGRKARVLIPGVKFPGPKAPDGIIRPGRPLKISSAPLLNLTFTDFRHAPQQRVGKLILPLGPSFEGELA